MRSSQCVSQHFAFVLHRSSSVQLTQSQTNSKCSRSSQFNAKHVRATMHLRKRLKYSSLPKMLFPNSFFNQSSVLFFRPRVARTEWCRPVIYNCVLAPRTRDYPKLRNQLLWRSLVDRATSRTLSLSRSGRSDSSPRVSALPLAPCWAPCSLVLPSLAG